MKKILKFLRSMKFGMILLVLVVLCSLAGSFVEQGREAAFYQQQMPSSAGVILALGLDRIFSTWYFLLLMALLCVNLLFCSVLRLKSTIAQRANCFDHALSARREAVSGKAADKIAALLRAKRFKVFEQNGEAVYYKNRLGYFGSFATHLGLLLVLVFAAGAMYLSVYEDQSILPGESFQMEDGTVVAVDSFTLGEGRLPDYRSVLQITDKHGEKSGPREISVNYPLSFGGHKFFQQSYGALGHMTVTNEGQSSPVLLEPGMLITLDGTNGIHYDGLYPDHVVDEDGKIVPVNAPNYVNPVYLACVIENGVETTGVVLPGTTFSVDGVQYTFDPPTFFPGIRIKTVPAVMMGLLYFSFGLLTAGLYLCFFHAPVLVAVGKQGYALSGQKNDPGLAADIRAVLQNNASGRESC